MKKLGYYLASTLLLTGALLPTLDAAGCGGCQRQKNAGKARGSNDDVTFTPACGNCNKRVSISSPMPHWEELQVYGQFADMAALNRKFAGGKHTPEYVSESYLAQKGCWFGSGQQQFQSIPQFMKEKDHSGAALTLFDGSVWAIADEDQWTVRNWTESSELAIKPNALSLWNKLTGSSPSCKYRIVNMATNQSAAAKLLFGPFRYNPNTTKIEMLDYFTGQVTLNNGTNWFIDMSGPSSDVLRRWKRGQAVICGTNDTWFSLGSPFILINVESDNWLAANRY
jgi:hypothetical protein